MSEQAEWRRMTLGDVLTVIRGVSYKKEQASNRPVDGYLPVLRATNIQDRLTFEDLVYVPKSNVSSEQLLRKGDIVIAASSGSRAIVGKAAQLNKDWKGSFGAFCFGLRPTEAVNPRFIGWFLQTREYRNRVYELAAGVNINNLRAKHIEETPIRLPPVEEQQHIVAEIEKQFTRLDVGVVLLKRIQAALKRYRASVLKAACEGRLVPTEAELARQENRSYETGEQLLQRILKDRREKWNGKGKYKEPAAPEIADVPGLPKGWTRATAEQLSDPTRSITYGVIKLGSEIEGGVAVLRSSDVRHLRLDLDSVKRIAPAIANEFRRTFLLGGEVLVTVRGTLGGVVVVPAGCNGFNISREVAMIAFTEPRLARFVAMMIASTPLQNWLLRRTKGIAYTGINIETLKQLPIPLPPLVEQDRIVEKIDSRLSVIDELECLVSTELQRATRLRQSILQEAFAGEQSHIIQ